MDTQAEEKEKPDFSDVDETTPNSSGVYELHSAESLKVLATHPDGKFKLLWDIDLQGAEWTPIAEFTGEIEGQNYTISNFTVKAGEDTGFIGVNKGSVKNVQLNSCSFSGPMNTKDGKLYTALAGAEENVEYKDCLWQDNSNSDEFLKQENLALRQKVEEMMRLEGTVEWTADENLNFFHPNGSTLHTQIFVPGVGEVEVKTFDFVQ